MTGQYVQPTYTVNVSDGQLSLRFANLSTTGDSYYFALDALQIQAGTVSAGAVAIPDRDIAHANLNSDPDTDSDSYANPHTNFHHTESRV